MTRNPSRLVAIPLAFALTISSVWRVAVAEPTAAELTAARDLFDRGLKLEEQNQWAQALEKFRKVAAVKTTPAVRFHVALCLENLGKLVDALNEFERAQSEAASESSNNATTVANNSARHVALLHERIPRVTIQLPSGVSDATITIDGGTVSTGLAGTEIPLDPGAHAITVTAPGKLPFEKKIELVERQPPIVVEVTLHDEAVTSPVVPSTEDDPGKKDVVDPPEHPSHGPGALPWIVGSIGVAALGGAGVFYLMRASTISDLDSACQGPNRTQCPQSKSDVADKGKTYSTVSAVLLGVGAVGVATAVVLFLVAPSSSSDAKSAAISHKTWAIVDGPAPLGLGVAAAF